jgi:hypothetical protein
MFRARIEREAHMESKHMAVETSAASAGEVARILGIWFWVGLGMLAFFAVSLAALMVMIATLPRTTREWATALTSTLFSSFGGGISVVLYFDLHRRLWSVHDVELVLAMLQITSVLFVCGLPGWVLVRIAFNTMAKFKDATGDAVYDALKGKLP